MTPFRLAGAVLGRRSDLAEQAAVLAASAAAGGSFQRGLMPRSTTDQAIVTGLLVATNYGIVVTGQGAVDAVANAWAGPEASAGQFRRRALALELAVAGAGLLVQRALPARVDESMARAGIRAAGVRASMGGSAGAIGVLASALGARLTGRPLRTLPVAPLAVAGAGVAAATYAYLRRGLREQGSTDEHGMPVETEDSQLAGRAVLAGAGVAGATFAVAYGERLLAHSISWPLRRALPGPVARATGHAAALGLFGTAGWFGIRKVLHGADATGAAIEAAYSSRPESPHATGGPASVVDWDTLGREGRRVVNMTMTREEISEATGRTDATDPVRAFVGVGSAATPEERADLALRELEALGGLDRPLIVFYTPTGTGYVNYVALETVEHLTGGHCAQVALQYSLRPSPMSLNRVGLGKEQNQAFLTALRERLDTMPADRRPRVVVFGESLGAQTGADTLFEGHHEMDAYGVDRALFIGMPNSTPAPRAWRRDKAAMDPAGQAVEIGTYDEWLALPEAQRDRLRVVLLSQHDDPIVKFGMPLAVQRPDWLGDDRPPGVPPELRWRPFATFLTTMIDAKNAMSVVPGTFVSRGHDYRGQLAAFVRDVFRLEDPPAGMESVERALRARELAWATRRVSAEQAQAAEEAVRAQLDKWGVSTDRLPPLVQAPVAEDDPLGVPAAEIGSHQG